MVLPAAGAARFLGCRFRPGPNIHVYQARCGGSLERSARHWCGQVRFWLTLWDSKPRRLGSIPSELTFDKLLTLSNGDQSLASA